MTFKFHPEAEKEFYNQYIVHTNIKYIVVCLIDLRLEK